MITLSQTRCDSGEACASDVASLQLAAARARRNVLRMLEANPAGHVGGALSAIDMVVTIYRHAMKLGPANYDAPDRDRFLLSAGHKALAQYAALVEVGIVPAEVLDTYGQTDSKLPGHPDMHRLPGVEANTGALGHGLPIAVGMALGARLAGRTSRVYVLMGDGELPEGSNWEAAAFAAHHGLDNLTVFVDVNGMQISGPTAQVMNMESIAAKFAAFGWAVHDIDGHDVAAITGALDALPLQAGQPTAILAHTTKAKGISEVEGLVASHYWKPTPSQLRAAVEEADEAVRRAQGLVMA